MAIDLRDRARQRLARETGTPSIDRAAPVRFALAFPNIYGVGMASLGFQLIYRMLNDLPKSSCERVFLPDPEDAAEHLRSGAELFTLESLSPLAQFDVVAFSVSFEMDYLNVLRMLRLANLPVERAERDESRPLVIAGGPCATFNPEPLADFVDAFVIGDAEDVIPRLVDALEANQGGSREGVLAALAGIPGVYVPSLYRPHYSEEGELLRVEAVPPAPEKVSRAVAADLACHPSASIVSTPEAEFGEIELLEVARGCGRKCRFCAAGHIARPPRPRAAGEVTGAARLGLVGAAVFDRPDAEEMCRRIVDAGGEFTVSSVRLETVTPAIARLMAQGGQKTLTIAPEAGSERLRHVINKAASEAAIFSAAAAARDAGIARMKLYFMIGLPTEADEDVAAIVDLVRRLAREFPSIGFQLSVSTFVPKPWTPFQWHPMEREGVLKRRYAALKKGVSAIRGAKLGGESPRLAAIQGYLARGDRRIGQVLVAALENGGDYPAAVRGTGVDTGWYLYRTRPREETLPWDHVDVLVGKDYLWREYQKALKGETTDPCAVGVCRECGVCA